MQIGNIIFLFLSTDNPKLRIKITKKKTSNMFPTSSARLVHRRAELDELRDYKYQ